MYVFMAILALLIGQIKFPLIFLHMAGIARRSLMGSFQGKGAFFVLLQGKGRRHKARFFVARGTVGIQLFFCIKIPFVIIFVTVHALIMCHGCSEVLLVTSATIHLLVFTQ